MMKRIPNQFYIIFLLLFAYFNSNAQLSMVNRIDTFKGYNTSTVYMDDGFLLFNNPQNYNDSIKFRFSYFTECGYLKWTKDFYADSLTGNYDPDVLEVGQSLFVLLKSRKESNNPHLMTLLKIDKYSQNLIYSTNIYNQEKSLLSYTANLSYNPNTQNVYVVSADKKGNTAILAFNANSNNAELKSSKLIKNIKHGSSVFDQEGNLVIFSSDSLYANIRVNQTGIDTVIWAKKLKNRFFGIVNDPLAIQATTGNRVTMVVIDTLLKIDTTATQTKNDTAIYRLVSFNLGGNITTESDGFLGSIYKSKEAKNQKWDAKLKKYDSDLKNIYILNKNRVGFYGKDLQKISDGKYYKFQKDSFDVVDANLTVLQDSSLLLSGFCYNRTKSGEYNIFNPYIFVSKTQVAKNKFEIKGEQPAKCIVDSIDATKVTLKSTSVNSIGLKDTLVSFYLTKQSFKNSPLDLNKFHNDQCGKVIMEAKGDTLALCPNTPFLMSVEWYLWAKYKWSTGENSTSVTKYEPGIYKVIVSLCDTTKIATFEYILTDKVEDCYTVYIPEVFVPDDKDKEENKSFKTFQKREFVYSEYNLEVFDRWGEKVFTTDDAKISWDGNFRGNQMPAGVYLYRLKWKAKDLPDAKPVQVKGQIMLLR
jgi:gliding motility-associated-like protein